MSRRFGEYRGTGTYWVTDWREDEKEGGDDETAVPKVTMKLSVLRSDGFWREVRTVT